MPDMEEHPKFDLVEQLFRYGITTGSVDLIQGGHFKEDIGGIIAACCNMLRNDTGKRLFSGITVILPPAEVSTLSTQSVFEVLTDALNDMYGVELNSEQLGWLRGFVKVLISPSLDTSDLVALFEKANSGWVVVIAEANMYRSNDVDVQLPFGVTAVRLLEDVWVPHVASICRASVNTAKAIDGYVVVHVSESPAKRQANQEILVGIDDCYVTCIEVEDDPEQVVSLNAKRWVAMAIRGLVDQVRDEIHALKIDDVSRSHLLVQILNRAGLEDELLTEIDQMLVIPQRMSVVQRVQLASLAIKASSPAHAQQLLSDGLVGLVEEMWLEEALEVATQLENNDLIASADHQLSTLFPHSTRLQENRDRRLLLNCRWALNKKLAFSTAGFSEQHRILSDALACADAKYENICQQASEWGAQWDELASICCAVHAETVGNAPQVVLHATPVTESDRFGRQAAQILLSSVRRLMLKEEVSSTQHDFYRSPLVAVVRYLAQNPQDTKIRSSLTSTFSVEACGEIGIPIAALLALNLSSESVKLTNSQDTQIEPDQSKLNTSYQEGIDGTAAQQIQDDDELREVVDSGLEWMAQQTAVEPGVTLLPVEMAGQNPDQIIKKLVHIVLMIGDRIGEDADLKFMENMALLICAMAPHASEERNEDLRILRMYASQLAISGQAQKARDLCEQLLLMGQEGVVRKRLAWAAYADIYHRCNQPVESLVGIACAMATKAQVETADLWQEVYILIRILRDLGLIKYANQLMPVMKELLERLGFDSEHDPRVTTTELSLRLKAASEMQLSELSQLVEDMAVYCNTLFERRSDLLPATTLLAQTVLMCDTSSAPVSDHARDILAQALKSIGSSTSQFVSTVSAISPTPFQVVELYNSVQRALYAGDATGDYTAVTTAARRLLNREENRSPTAEIASLAVELLADQGVEFPAPPPLLTAGWSLSYAQELSSNGLDVVFLGMDSAGELLVTHVYKGQVFQVEQQKEEQSFRRRMQVWLEDYPRRYGLIDTADGYNEFYGSMEALKVQVLAEGKLLVIAEPMLQQLTMNLALVEPSDGGFSFFLGSKVAIGAAPSLTWISLARESQRKEAGGYKAWISVDDEPSNSGALNVVHSRLRDTFDRYGFIVDTGRKLPRNVSDASLVVVSAHGGLTNEGRFIHTIRDEGSLVEAPGALAAALSGVELVVLFVCSGGRIDKHPFDNATVGLPKQLLNKGCRAVVASPWPLDVKVTYNWLDPFLRAWEAGETVLSATKMANEAVSRNLGDHPQYSMAMTVYGDVLLTKPR